MCIWYDFEAAFVDDSSKHNGKKDWTIHEIASPSDDLSCIYGQLGPTLEFVCAVCTERPIIERNWWAFKRYLSFDEKTCLEREKKTGHRAVRAPLQERIELPSIYRHIYIAASACQRFKLCIVSFWVVLQSAEDVFVKHPRYDLYVSTLGSYKLVTWSELQTRTR